MIAIDRINRQVLSLRSGETKSINISELLAGDIIYLKQGDKVFADCLIIEGDDVNMKESYEDGEIIVSKNI